MIIKSMSRKHPSFAQLIDYIEGESKLKSRHFSIHHNLYSRDSDRLKNEFAENAKHLRFRKNGVYLYHEVLSMTRSHALSEEEQKEKLQSIVREYLNARAKNNLAYAVLHEDTDNLHFHIVMSANEAGETSRKRLSKEQFSDIQTRLEAWVLRDYGELEQRAVFHKNQTHTERAEREAKKSHLSDKGEQMKRRGARTERRDTVQEQLADIFETATDPRDLTARMEQAGFALYTRGNTHGVTDREGNKYRLSRLGLGDAWQALDERMTQGKNTRPGETKKAQEEEPKEVKNATESEAEKRLREIKEKRAKAREKTSQKAKTQDRDRG